MAAAEPEGERQRQHEPAEQRAERDQHHVAADADLDERRGNGEEEHDRPGSARQKPRLDDAGVDRGDQRRLPEDGAKPPTTRIRSADSRRGREEAQEHAGRTGGAGDRQGVDAHRREDHEDARNATSRSAWDGGR